MVSLRDIEKLRAIGYEFSLEETTEGTGDHQVKFQGERIGWRKDATGRILCAKTHAQSPEGMKATMAAKCDFLVSVQIICDGTGNACLAIKKCAPAFSKGATDGTIGSGRNSADAVDALFWSVP